jgi:hypothetical protein
VFILLQQPGDTMLLDSVAGHRRTEALLRAFLEKARVRSG